jgi:hypothetical protein
MANEIDIRTARQYIITRAEGLSDEAYGLIARAARLANPAELAELAETANLLRTAERIIANYGGWESAEDRLFRAITEAN